MKQATELRINNWVFDTELKTKVRIVNINHDGFLRVFSDEITSSHITDITGIKLTKELMISSGFKEEEGFYYLGELWLELLENFEFRVDGLGFKHRIKYLHELQNLVYALSNKELKIK